MNTAKNVRKNAPNLGEVLQQYSLHPEFIGLQLHDINQPGATGDAPLHIAVRRGVEQDVIDLLRLNADVNMIGDLGNTPLHFAAMTGRGHIVELLLRAGANPRARNMFDETPLQVAHQGGKGNIVTLLKRVT